MIKSLFFILLKTSVAYIYFESKTRPIAANVFSSASSNSEEVGLEEGSVLQHFSIMCRISSFKENGKMGLKFSTVSISMKRLAPIFASECWS